MKYRVFRGVCVSVCECVCVSVYIHSEAVTLQADMLYCTQMRARAAALHRGSDCKLGFLSGLFSLLRLIKVVAEEHAFVVTVHGLAVCCPSRVLHVLIRLPVLWGSSREIDKSVQCTHMHRFHLEDAIVLLQRHDNSTEKDLAALPHRKAKCVAGLAGLNQVDLNHD